MTFGGGGGGGSSSISGSTDVALSNAAGNEVLSYDGGIAKWKNATAVNQVNGRSGAVTLAKADVGLTNVDNTSDANKPVSTATQTALNAKADATAVGAKLLLIDQAVDLPPGTPAGVVVVVKNP